MNQQCVHSNTYEKETHSDHIVYDVSSAGSQYSLSETDDEGKKAAERLTLKIS
jgi:hypothetical protein